MPEKLAHRELRNRSSEVLREVAAGASYEITNHGDVVALLSPIESGHSLRVRPARVSGGFLTLRRVKIDAPVAEALNDLRGDR